MAHVGIIAEAGPAIGAGHLMRCRALALSLRDLGAEVTVTTHPGARTLVDALDWRGVAVVSAGLDDAAAGGARFDWIVADGYGFDEARLASLRAAAAKLAVIDDRPRLASYPADLLLDQNVGALRQPYGPGPRLLLGSRFVLLRPEAAAAIGAVRPAEGGARVLVTGGAAAGAGTLARIVDAIAEIGDVRVTVTSGSLAGTDGAPADDQDERVRIVRGATDLTALMRDADVAVSAIGGTIWELAALGIPAVVFGTSDVHRPIGEAVHGYGAHRYAGQISEASPSLIASVVHGLLSDAGARAEMSRLGRKLVDGGGARRVAHALLDPEPAGWRIREAAPSDDEPVWEIAADPGVRRMSHDSTPFPFASHESWFAAKVTSSGSRLFVIERDGTVGGFVRYDVQDDDAALVSLALAPAFRGQGLGTQLLDETPAPALAALGRSHARAYVQDDNGASLRAFEKAGFARAGVEEIAGRRCAVFERARSHSPISA